MKQLILSVLTVFFFGQSFGQSTKIKDENLELTIKNIKRMFSIATDDSSPDASTIWTACYNSENTYSKADTVELYSDEYYYMSVNCCYVTTWQFENSTTMDLSVTDVCEEPPVSSINGDDFDLRLKFKEENGVVKLAIFSGKVLRDEFIVAGLDIVELREKKEVYHLTLIRKK